ncbi:reverse transcriptase domain-containing protein [Tanacetum coccineum]
MEQKDEAKAFRMLEGLRKLRINRPLIRAVRRMPEYLKYMKDVFSSKKPIMEEDAPPRGIIENVLVQIDKFIFPVDIVIMDMVEDLNAPLVLGRPLLATAHAHIDVFNKQISLGVGEERILFKMNELVDDPYITHESVCLIRFSRETHEEEIKLILAKDSQLSFTKMKAQSCDVNTNEKSEPFI